MSTSDHDDLRNCSMYAVAFWSKGPPFRAVIGLTCFLSIIGSLLIIFSYACFKSLRNNARLVLVHLSLMDFGVGIVNLIGNLIYFDRFYYPDGPCSSFHQPTHNYVNGLCIAQGFLAHFFTQASILWTLFLAVFLYFLIVHRRSNISTIALRFSYLLCYGFPIVICVWLICTNRFGYSPYNTGWCSILIIDSETKMPDVYVAVLAYDLWIYMTMLLVPILYLSVQLFLRQKLRQTRKYLTVNNTEEKFWEAVNVLDYKFLLIPVAFTILRMWTCIVDILYVYIQVEGVPLWCGITLQYLSGIGDSGQGFANAILFVLFTRKVRQTIFKPKFWKAKLLRNQNYQPLLDPDRQSLPNVGINDPHVSSGSYIYTPNQFVTSGSFPRATNTAEPLTSSRRSTQNPFNAESA